MKKFLILIILALGFLSADRSQAAILEMKSSTDSIYLKDSFILEIRVDTQDKAINAVQTTLKYNPSALKALDFSKGNSILGLFTQEPLIDNELGQIAFSGGSPGGFLGEGTVAKIIFQAIAPGETNFEFGDSMVLLNDGMGTRANLSFAEWNLMVLASQRTVPLNAWQEELEGDKNPPTNLEISLIKNSEMFDGKYFLVFSAQDQESGIDHFEIQEDGKNWQLAQSPYLLKDQALKNKILVKAVDKAGNETISQAEIPQKFPYWTLILLIPATLLAALIIKKKRGKRK